MQLQQYIISDAINDQDMTGNSLVCVPALSIFLSYLIKSLMAKKIVFNASVTTSVPSIAAAATGTGFA